MRNISAMKFSKIHSLDHSEFASNCSKSPSSPEACYPIKQNTSNYLSSKTAVSRIPRQVTGVGHEGTVCSVLNFGSFVFSGSQDKTVRVWLASTGALVACLSGHEGPILCLAAKGSLLYSGSEDGTIHVWAIPSWHCISTVHCQRGPVWSLALNHSGSRLYSGMNDGSILVWSTPLDNDEDQSVAGNGQLLANHVLTAHRGPVYALVVGGDCLYSGATDRQIKVWFVGIRRQLSLGNPNHSPSSSRGKQHHGSRGPRSPLGTSSPSQFSSRFGELDKGSSSTVSVEMRSLRKLGSSSWPRHEEEGDGCDFAFAPSSPHTPLLDQCSADRPVAVAIYEGHTDEVLSLAYDGETLYSGDASGVVQAWESWSPAPLLNIAHSKSAGPCLSTIRSRGHFVRALAVHGDVLYVGSQHIEVWRREDSSGERFLLEDMMASPTGHVIALSAAESKLLGRVVLVSGSMDKDVNMWFDIKGVEKHASRVNVDAYGQSWGVNKECGKLLTNEVENHQQHQYECLNLL